MGYPCFFPFVSELPPYQVELFLRVQKANQSAVDFYSRKGFRVVGEENPSRSPGS